MHAMVEDMGLLPGQVLSRSKVEAWFGTKYPKVKYGTVAAHLLRLSTNAPSRLHYNAKSPEDDLFYQIDGGHFRLFDPQKDPAPIVAKLGGFEIADDDKQPAGELDHQSAEFAYERDLRNFLAKNMARIESGLRLYEDEGITGVEFPVGGRFVDILGVDLANQYVVIELKVSKGYDRVVGQLLRYMAWIEQHHAEPGQAVRGVIVAREISDDLRLACSKLPTVTLFEYSLSVTLKPISLSVPGTE